MKQRAQAGSPWWRYHQTDRIDSVRFFQHQYCREKRGRIIRLWPITIKNNTIASSSFTIDATDALFYITSNVEKRNLKAFRLLITFAYSSLASVDFYAFEYC